MIVGSLVAVAAVVGGYFALKQFAGIDLGIKKEVGALTSDFEKKLLDDILKGIGWTARKGKALRDSLHAGQLEAFKKQYDDIMDGLAKNLAKAGEYGSAKHMKMVYKTAGIVFDEVKEGGTKYPKNIEHAAKAHKPPAPPEAPPAEEAGK